MLHWFILHKPSRPNSSPCQLIDFLDMLHTPWLRLIFGLAFSMFLLIVLNFTLSRYLKFFKLIFVAPSEQILCEEVVYILWSHFPNVLWWIQMNCVHYVCVHSIIGNLNFSHVEQICDFELNKTRFFSPIFLAG